MPETSSATLDNAVRSASLELLWRQWQAVGAGAAASRSANALVDPEALILMSLWMLDQEQRLADVATSWVTVNSSLVGIQRLRNMRGAFPPVVSKRLSGLAEIAINKGKDARWASLRTKGTLVLGARANKNRAVEVPFRSWATLLLQLRRGIGVGAKADVLAFLLGANVLGSERPEWASVAMIAEATSYTPAAVRRVSDDLAAAKFIRSLETIQGERRAQRMYSVRTVSWTQLLEIGTHQPGWAYWKELFLFIIDLLNWFSEQRQRPATQYALDVLAREILERHRTVLMLTRVVDSTQFVASELDVKYLEQTAQALCGWMSNLG